MACLICGGDHDSNICPNYKPQSDQQRNKPSPFPNPLPEQKEREINVWGTISDPPIRPKPKKEEE